MPDALKLLFGIDDDPPAPPANLPADRPGWNVLLAPEARAAVERVGLSASSSSSSSPDTSISASAELVYRCGLLTLRLSAAFSLRERSIINPTTAATAIKMPITKPATAP